MVGSSNIERAHVESAMSGFGNGICAAGEFCALHLQDTKLPGLRTHCQRDDIKPMPMQMSEWSALSQTGIL